MEKDENSDEVSQPANLESFTASPEELKRWDDDIATMESLKNIASASGGVFALGDGYAVEAHCGGEITRTHGDIDGKLYLGTADATTFMKVTEDIAGSLHGEQTQWALHGSKTDEKLEYREDAPDKEFVRRRRLELQLFSSSSEGNIQRKTLIDSNGVKHEIDVDDINLLSAIKIRIINDRLDMSDEERATHRRHLKQQDIDEVKRLMAQPDFDEEKTLKRLAGHTARRKGLDEIVAMGLAKAQLQRVTSLKLGPETDQKTTL